MSPSPLSSFDLRRRAFPSARVSASLHMIVLKGDADCSLVSSFSLSFRHGAFIGAIEIYAAFHPGFGVFFDVEPRTSSSFHKNLFSFQVTFFTLSLSAAFKDGSLFFCFYFRLSSSLRILRCSRRHMNLHNLLILKQYRFLHRI